MYYNTRMREARKHRNRNAMAPIYGFGVLAVSIICFLLILAIIIVIVRALVGSG